VNTLDLLPDIRNGGRAVSVVVVMLLVASGIPISDRHVGHILAQLKRRAA
jgi:hypothetical protein